MPVVSIRKMRVRMRQCLVRVRVAVSCSRRHGIRVHMLVMRIVHVRMVMRHGLVRVFVRMALTQVEPDTQCHQACGREQPQAP